MAYERALPGCFGDVDLIFAGHPLDKRRAFEWLASLRMRQIGLAGAKEQVREYLTDKGAGGALIDEQLTAVERHLKPWLSD